MTMSETILSQTVGAFVAAFVVVAFALVLGWVLNTQSRQDADFWRTYRLALNYIQTASRESQIQNARDTLLTRAELQPVTGSQRAALACLWDLSAARVRTIVFGVSPPR